MERNCKRGEVLCLVVKHWLRILQMVWEELVRRCYEWQISNLKFGSWAKKLKEELNKRRLGNYLARCTGE
jgi:hypothetical protein